MGVGTVVKNLDRKPLAHNEVNPPFKLTLELNFRRARLYFEISPFTLILFFHHIEMDLSRLCVSNIKRHPSIQNHIVLDEQTPDCSGTQSVHFWKRWKLRVQVWKWKLFYALGSESCKRIGIWVQKWKIKGPCQILLWLGYIIFILYPQGWDGMYFTNTTSRTVHWYDAMNLTNHSSSN